MFFHTRKLSLALTVISLTGAMAAAQEVGGSLGSSAGLFRGKNPKPATVAAVKIKADKSPARAAKIKAAAKIARTERAAALKSGGDKPAKTKAGAVKPADAANRIEALIVEGNEARDARSFINAELAYQRARELNPKDARPIYGLGNIYTDQQRWDEAEIAYREALKVNPLQSEANVALAYVLLQPNRGGNIAARFGEAEFAARRAIRIEPDNPMAFDQLGVSLELRGLVGADAENAYRRAVELDPGFALAYAHLARLLKKLNRFDESSDFYQKAIKFAQDVPTMILVAEVLQSENKFAESETLLRTARQLDEDNPTVLFLLGRALAMRGNYVEAQTVLLRSIRISPRTFAVWNQLGVVYLRQEKFEDAERIFAVALPFASEVERQQLAGTFGFIGIGDGYMKTGNTAAALRVYRQAKELDQTNLQLTAKIAAAGGNR